MKNQTTGQQVDPDPFYCSVVRSEFGGPESLTPPGSILVVCGGNLDRVSLLECGIKSGVISNLAPHIGHDEYHPFTWERQDVEKLSYPDESFDVAVVHSGLHHCYNPIHALGEMCRVARKRIIVFEPYETWFTRLGAWIGIGQQYEDLAVFADPFGLGGVANTEIPNYVYRFSESEVLKFASAFMPLAKPRIRVYRAIRLNRRKFQVGVNPLIRVCFSLLYPVLLWASKRVKSLNNNVCFVIDKPRVQDFHPWIKAVDGLPRLNRSVIDAKYGSRK
jgi:SAM-dependent methyltransferase